ncbi:unnamed protein product, partial [Rotaria magnacalcarata]
HGANINCHIIAVLITIVNPAKQLIRENNSTSPSPPCGAEIPRHFDDSSPSIKCVINKKLLTIINN